MKDLRVAVWGLGRHAVKNIVSALQDCPSVRLHGVCSRDTEAVARVARETESRAWTDPADMLADPDLDVVYVATPIGVHASQGTTVLQAGKHLWCEKPLATSAADAGAVARLARNRGLVVAEGFMYLYHPQFSYLRQVVVSERLGPLQRVSCRFGIPPLAEPGFRTSRELGGGAFLDVGSYPISAVTALFPDGEPEVVAADIAGGSATSVDSSGYAVLRYSGQVIAMLEWGTDRAYRNEIDIWGRAGSVSSERIFSKPMDYVPEFRFRDLHGAEHSEGGTPANHFVAMLESFRDLVADGAGAERERAQIMRRARLAEAIRMQSTIQGRSIEVSRSS